jgi:hypothetical protein
MEIAGLRQGALRRAVPFGTICYEKMDAGDIDPDYSKNEGSYFFVQLRKSQPACLG